MNKILRLIFGVIIVIGVCINFVIDNKKLNDYISILLLIDLLIQLVLFLYS